MLRPGNVESMVARLVLAVGSHAGLEAPLHNGYYMIGRHPECQIRPKSRSVSRRHCLLFAQNGGVQVRDLNSASGTKVNDRRLDGGEWVKLGDGDELRCGKVVFQVSIKQSADGDVSQGGMVTAEPWQSFDVASMLESADEEERAKRYEQIRGGESDEDDGGFSVSVSDSDDLTDVQIEMDAFADAFSDDATVPTQPTNTTSAQDVGGAAAEAKPKTESPKTQASPKTQTSKTKTSKPKPLPRAPKKMRRKISGGKSPGFSASSDRIKFVAAVVLVISVVGFFGYRVYRFSSGPSVRVIENID